MCGSDKTLCPDEITFRFPKRKLQKPPYGEWMVYPHILSKNKK